MQEQTPPDELTRSRMLQAFDAAAARGEVAAPSLMTDDGRARYPEIVRHALAEGTADSLVNALSDPSLWQLYTFGVSYQGFGSIPSDWLGEAARSGRREFRRWQEAAVGQAPPGVETSGLAPENAGGDSRPAAPELGAPFVVEDTRFYFHPRHPDFYINSFGGALFFARIPGTPLNLNVTLDQIGEGDWQEFRTDDGTLIPVVLRREGGAIVAQWR